MHETGLSVDDSLSVSLLKAHKNNFTVLRGRLDRTLVPVPGTRTHIRRVPAYDPHHLCLWSQLQSRVN